jgi:hypothetical protein
MKLLDPSYVYQVLAVEQIKDGDTVVLRIGKDYERDVDVDFGFNVKDSIVLHKEAVSLTVTCSLEREHM